MKKFAGAWIKPRAPSVSFPSGRHELPGDRGMERNET